MPQRKIISRREFFQAAGAGALAAPVSGFWTPQARAAAQGVGPMKITKIEAVRFRPDLRIQGLAPNWKWVRLHTDKGIVGSGESYPGYDAHRVAVKDLAPIVLGKDPTR